jgi:Bacterial dnaA protein helix-turn-helix
MHDFQVLSIIVEVVAKMAGLKTTKRLYGNERAPSLIKLRDTALYLIRTKTSLSLEEIGRPFNKGHTVVLVAVRREELRLQRCPPRADKLTWPQYHERIMAEVDKAIAVATAAPLVN